MEWRDRRLKPITGSLDNRPYYDLITTQNYIQNPNPVSLVLKNPVLQVGTPLNAATLSTLNQAKTRKIVSSRTLQMDSVPAIGTTAALGGINVAFPPNNENIIASSYVGLGILGNGTSIGAATYRVNYLATGDIVRSLLTSPTIGGSANYYENSAVVPFSGGVAVFNGNYSRNCYMWRSENVVSMLPVFPTDGSSISASYGYAEQAVAVLKPPHNVAFDAIIAGGHISAGVLATSAQKNVYASVWGVNIANGTRTALASLDSARWGIAAATGKDGRCYFIGGCSRYPNTLIDSDYNNPPDPITGGYDTSAGAIDVYDRLGNKLPTITGMTPAFSSAVTAQDGSIFIFGGSSLTTGGGFVTDRTSGQRPPYEYFTSPSLSSAILRLKPDNTLSRVANLPVAITVTNATYLYPNFAVLWGGYLGEANCHPNITVVYLGNDEEDTKVYSFAAPVTAFSSNMSPMSYDDSIYSPLLSFGGAYFTTVGNTNSKSAIATGRVSATQSHPYQLIVPGSKFYRNIDKSDIKVSVDGNIILQLFDRIYSEFGREIGYLEGG